MPEWVLDALRFIYGEGLSEGQAEAIWKALNRLPIESPVAVPEPAKFDPITGRPVKREGPAPKLRKLTEADIIAILDARVGDDPTRITGIDAVLVVEPPSLKLPEGKILRGPEAIFKAMDNAADKAGVDLTRAETGRRQFREDFRRNEVTTEILGLLQEAELLTPEQVQGFALIDTQYEKQVLKPFVDEAYAAFEKTKKSIPGISVAQFLPGHFQVAPLRTLAEFTDTEGRYGRFIQQALALGLATTDNLGKLNTMFDALLKQADRLDAQGIALDFDEEARRQLGDMAEAGRVAEERARVAEERGTRRERFFGLAETAGILRPGATDEERMALEQTYQDLEDRVGLAEAQGQEVDFQALATEALAKAARGEPPPGEMFVPGTERLTPAGQEARFAAIRAAAGAAPGEQITPGMQATFERGGAARREQERRLRGGFTKEEMDMQPGEAAELEQRRRAEEQATAGALQAAVAGGLPGGGFPSAAVQVQATRREAAEVAARRGAAQAGGPDFFAFLEREFGTAQREQEARRGEAIATQQELGSAGQISDIPFPGSVKVEWPRGSGQFMFQAQPIKSLFPAGTPGGEMLNIAVGKPLTFSDWLGTNMPQLRSKFAQGGAVAKTATEQLVEQQRREEERIVEQQRREEERRRTPRAPRATIFTR